MLKNQSANVHTQRGFSLLELLIVVGLIAVVSAISVIGYQAVMRGSTEKIASSKLYEIGEAQMQYRVGMGRPRYATLQELRTTKSAAGTPLVNELLSPADSAGHSLPSQGWIIREPAGAPSGDALRSSYAIEAVPADANVSSNVYCLHEDGVLRRGTVEAGCSRTSPAADPQATPTPTRLGPPIKIADPGPVATPPPGGDVYRPPGDTDN